MGRKTRKRRQSHGSAWHWKQTDCWYYTQPGSKKRVPLFDQAGERLRGRENKEAAEVALAREKLSWEEDSGGLSGHAGEWIVARVCSEYLKYCEQGVFNGSVSQGHHYNSRIWLNDLCAYCGALPVAQLKKGHIQTWIDKHKSWKSSATRRCVIAVVHAAFNRADEMFGIANPIKGIKKPNAEPRLASFTPQEEQALYGATEPCFGNFLFAAVHTGLRPFSELARLTANDVEESQRGMMWRVYASKTKKTRKIPVRPEVAELTRKLMKTAPRNSGIPIFRNTQNNLWKSASGVARFLTIKKKLFWDQDPVKGKYSCYTARHTFAHRMLSGYWTDGTGCSIETLAELIGDTPKVAFDHYGREWGQHYQEPLWKAIGEGVAGKATTKSPSRSNRGRSKSTSATKQRAVGERRSKTPQTKPSKKA